IAPIVRGSGRGQRRPLVAVELQRAAIGDREHLVAEIADLDVLWRGVRRLAAELVGGIVPDRVGLGVPFPMTIEGAILRAPGGHRARQHRGGVRAVAVPYAPGNAAGPRLACD